MKSNATQLVWGQPKRPMIKPPVEGLFQLRIGIGTEQGFLKIGPSWDSPDFVLDTKIMPWPIEDAIVDRIYASFYFHRLTRPERFEFMDECYRILKPGMQLIMVMPHWSSERSINDPLAQWPPLGASCFAPYSKTWREQERMTELPLKCDFASVWGWGTDMDQSVVGGRNEEFVQHARRHWLNANTDLHITMTRVDPPEQPKDRIFPKIAKAKPKPKRGGHR